MVILDGQQLRKKEPKHADTVTNHPMNAIVVTNHGYIDLRDLDWTQDGAIGFIGSGPYVVSTEPQKKSNPIGFIWPEEESRIILK